MQLLKLYSDSVETVQVFRSWSEPLLVAHTKFLEISCHGSISMQGFNIFSTILSGFLTIGLCTVPRKGASYLSLTLSRMIGGMKIRDKKDVVIVIFLASDDSVWLEETIKNIQFTYNDDIDSGLILVVQPKQHIYPDFRYICSSELMLYIPVFNYSVASGLSRVEHVQGRNTGPLLRLKPVIFQSQLEHSTIVL